MGLFDRLTRVVRAHLNDVTAKAEDPALILDQAVRDMEEDVVTLRSAVAKAIAAQKQQERKISDAESEKQNWEARARMALSKGDEPLARQALQRKQSLETEIATYRQFVAQHATTVTALKDSLMKVEAKLAEAKTKKELLKARADAAKAQEQLQGILGGLKTSGESASAVFSRMEEEVLQLEAKSQALGELSGQNLEDQFAALEAGNGIEDELARLKSSVELDKLMTGTPEPKVLPARPEPAKPQYPAEKYLPEKSSATLPEKSESSKAKLPVFNEDALDALASGKTPAKPSEVSKQKDVTPDAMDDLLEELAGGKSPAKKLEKPHKPEPKDKKQAEPEDPIDDLLKDLGL